MTDKETEFVKEITSKSEDFSQWYVDVIRKTELADYSTIKGCMVIRPYGFALWENIKAGLDKRIKASGHENAYFPLFIPESFLNKEAEHVKGFAPEVAWVTHGGNQKLEERLAIRPTSEAIICSMYAKWIRSWRDLPILINQWSNVVRWEKVTRFFLRTTEFLWQEGHTAHRTYEEAQEETLKMLDIYQDFVENDLAIPVIPGVKTEQEKFAGADKTYSIEALMSDGKALQAATSHNLGQHFAKVFDIKFLDEDQQEKFVWQTSWGLSSRIIGALIMTHGDDSGLIMPPRVAPIQVIIIPILYEKTKAEVLQKTEELSAQLKIHFRVKADTRDEYTPGWKYNEWEMKGVPIRLEIGPRDIKNKQAVLVRRDTREKVIVKEEELPATIENLLVDIQNNLLQRAEEFRENNTYLASDMEEFEKIIGEKRGFIKAYWCGGSECENKIKERTSATIRCIPLSAEEDGKGNCIYCGKEDGTIAYFARAY